MVLITALFIYYIFEVPVYEIKIYGNKAMKMSILNFLGHYILNTYIFISFSIFKLVELKNGETYNGHLVSCDNWMNINLREVICTSRVGSFVSV